MKLNLRKITLIGIRTSGGKYLVVSPPDDKRRRLVFAEVSLDLWIQWQVGPVIVEHIHLDIAIARPIKKCLVLHPVVWRDPAYVRHAIRVLKPCCLQPYQPHQYLTAHIGTERT